MAATDRIHSPTPEELMAYLDGEAPADACAGIQSHLAGCDECQTIVADQRSVSRQMHSWSVEDAPVTLRPPRVQRSPAWVLPAFSWRPSYLALSLGGVAVTLLLVVNLSTFAKRERRVIANMPIVAGRSISPDSPVQGRNGPLDRNGPPPDHGFANARGEKLEQQTRPSGKATPEAVAAPGTQIAAPRQPSVIRTATLRLVASDFNAARTSVEAIVAQAGGFLDQITVNGARGTAQTLTGTLRVPSTRLGDALGKLRQLGQVTEDTQGSEDVTDQLVDLDARLANARATEQRLTDILKNRTGKLSDVLEVEQEISRVRLEIEQMDAQRVNMGRWVTYATITLQIDEVRKAGLESGPLSLTTRIRVAAADGLESALESLVGAVLFVLRAGPALIIWLGALGSTWLLVRRLVRGQTPRHP